MSERRILLTGASGFVGQALVRHLARQGCSLTLVGRQSEAAVGNCRAVVADLAMPGSLRDALSRLPKDEPFDAIIHLAVSRHHREFPTRALDMFHVNSAAVADLLDFALATGVKQAVFGSTGTVYSATGSADAPDASGNREEEFNRPNSYFAASKLFADTLCELYRRHLRAAILRFYVPYGPGLEARMLTDLIGRVKDGNAISLPSAGAGLSFSATYIDDVVATILAALDREWNETVNVAAPEVWTMESAGELIAELLGRPATFARSAATSAPRVVPDTARLRNLLPDLRMTGLRDGLARLIAAEDERRQG